MDLNILANFRLDPLRERQVEVGYINFAIFCEIYRVAAGTKGSLMFLPREKLFPVKNYSP